MLTRINIKTEGKKDSVWKNFRQKKREISWMFLAKKFLFEKFTGLITKKLEQKKRYKMNDYNKNHVEFMSYLIFINKINV